MCKSAIGSIFTESRLSLVNTISGWSISYHLSVGLSITNFFQSYFRLAAQLYYSLLQKTIDAFAHSNCCVCYMYIDNTIMYNDVMN